MVRQCIYYQCTHNPLTSRWISFDAQLYHYFKRKKSISTEQAKARRALHACIVFSGQTLDFHSILSVLRKCDQSDEIRIGPFGKHNIHAIPISDSP